MFWHRPDIVHFFLRNIRDVTECFDGTFKCLFLRKAFANKIFDVISEMKFHFPD